MTRKWKNQRKETMEKRYLSNQKLWKVVRERGNYYYEIKLAGEIIDRIRIEEPTLGLLKRCNLL